MKASFRGANVVLWKLSENSVEQLVVKKQQQNSQPKSQLVICFFWNESHLVVKICTTFLQKRTSQSLTDFFKPKSRRVIVEKGSPIRNP